MTRNTLLCVAIALVAIATLAYANRYPELPLTQWGTPDYNVGLDQHNFSPKKYSGYTWLAKPAPAISDMPRDFSWCNKDGKNYCVANWQQHEPVYCGTCYIHGSLAAVNDRIKIANSKRKEPVLDVMLSRQTMINCGAARGGYGDGCNGGEAFDIFEYMRRYGLPDETCQNYMAHDKTCTPEALCANCMFVEGDDAPHCWPVPENQTIKYYVKEYGFVQGEQAIMAEILRNGPVVCGLTAPDSFAFGYHGGVYTDLTNSSDIDHDVEVAGWGEENGEKYWLIRNSWGSYWGMNGWFKLIRGVNNMHVEEQCAAAIVDTHELDWLLDGKVTGSMFGVIPKDQSPQYYPKHWVKGWPHTWKTTKAAGLETERANVHELDRLAAKEGIPATHVPKSVRRAEKKLGVGANEAEETETLRASLANNMIPTPMMTAATEASSTGVFIGGMFIGILATIASMAAYTKWSSPNQYQPIE